MTDDQLKLFSIDPFTLAAKAWHHVMVEINQVWHETLAYGWKDDWFMPSVPLGQDGSRIKFGPQVVKLTNL